ncbi:MAG: hypothetical protein WCQ67_00320 [Treponema sp.]
MQVRLSRCIILSTLLAIFCTFSLFSQIEIRKPSLENEDWRLLMQAQDKYDEKEYGTSLMLAEKAKESRKQDCSYKSYILDKVLKNTQVKKVGTSIDEVVKVLTEKKYNEALAIIDVHLGKYSKEYYGNNIINIKTQVEKENCYPEADYLIGRIYKLEGETDLSIKYMKNAYENNFYLDVAEQKYDILYDLADISKNTGKNDDYETYLLLILKDDDNFMNKSNIMTALRRTISNDTEADVEKFFILYRSSNIVSLKALSLLTEYYENTGKYEKALDCAALGSITCVTKIADILSERKINWKYTNINELLKTASSYSDIVDWGTENGVWKLLFDFAKDCASNGKIVFATRLMKNLAENEPVEYYRIQAENCLVK